MSDLTSHPAPGAKTGTAGQPQHKLFLQVQYLRAVAALMVVFQHSQFVHYPSWGGIFGTLGVDLFFAISGFVIFATTMGDFSLRDYLIKRCIRIIPIYWLLTGVMAVLVLGAPRLFSATVFTFEHFVRSLLFIPTFTPSRANEITPLLPPGWTLNYEMFFYVVFGVALYLLRNRTSLLVAMMALFGALVLIGSRIESNNALIITYTSPKILEFVAGMLAAYLLLYQSARLPSISASLLLMTAGWALLVYVGFFGGNIWLALPAVFLIVYAAASLDLLGATRPHALLKLLGDASYSIYLVHIFVIGAVKQVLIHTVGVSNSPLQIALFMAACIVASATAGALLYIWFEVPVLARLRKTLLPRKQASLQPV